MAARRPPYTITSAILARAEEIGEAIGRAEAAGVARDLRLRRINRIRTIRGSLAIEGNRLSEEQIGTILDGKPVVGPLRDIQEARNAIEAYDRYGDWDPASEADLLRAHGTLMRALLDAPGRYRAGRVVVMGDGEVQHIGPPAARVPAWWPPFSMGSETPMSIHSFRARSSTMNSNSSIPSKTATEGWGGCGRPSF